jgi:hypothetical protein|tara:strand:+ start:506 stop:751 length:246 start_codon:yes stop_codon:yes gene_type:complete
MSSQKIIDALQKGVITIVFEKIGTGEIRTMPCTLNNDISKQTLQIKKYTSPDAVICWGLDVEAWRDVRVDTIIEWYEGYPK